MKTLNVSFCCQDCSFFKGEELLHLKGVTFHNKLSKNRNVLKMGTGYLVLPTYKYDKIRVSKFCIEKNVCSSLKVETLK